MVLDDVGYHMGRLAKDRWLAHQDRARPRWLPVYAPELNLMERVWCDVNGKLNCHRWWADRRALEAATATLLSRIEARFHQPDPRPGSPSSSTPTRWPGGGASAPTASTPATTLAI